MPPTGFTVQTAGKSRKFGANNLLRTAQPNQAKVDSRAVRALMALLAMALWGLIVIAVPGIIKGLNVSGPGGMGISLTTTADDPDASDSDAD